MIAGYLFTDIEESTRRWEERPAGMRAAMGRHDRLIATIIAAHEGEIVDSAGDGVFALFRNEAALACALEIQAAFAREDWSAVGGLPVRIGVHAGGLDERGAPDRVVANRTARITACALGGQVLVSGEALTAFTCPPNARVIDRGAWRLRGVSDRLRLYTLTDPRLGPGASAAPRLLPPRTPFAPRGAVRGRERELCELLRLLDDGVRLLTVTGPAGAGKTTLMGELASRLDTSREIVWTSCAGLEAGDLGAAIARAAAISLPGQSPPLTQLIDQLAGRDLVVVLDGAEGCDETIVFARAVLSRCPAVSILVTSRAPLKEPGERIFPLAGLACDDASPDDIAASPAFEMFAGEVARLEQSFAPDKDGLADFARAVRLTGGSPLALKLIARWQGLLGFDEICRRIEAGPDALGAGAGEGRTLRFVFDAAFALLSEEERACLTRLSVFEAGFDADAGEAVGGFPAAVLLALEERGLVQRQGSGALIVHGLIAAYARTLCEPEAGLLEQARGAHARHFLGCIARSANARLDGAILDATERDLVHITRAFAFALAGGEHAHAAAAAEPLFYRLAVRSRFHEASSIFAQAPGAPSLAALFMALQANCLIHIGATDEARALALGALKAGAQGRAAGHAFHALGNLEHLAGNSAQARRYYEAALHLREPGLDPVGHNYTLLSLGWLWRHQGAHARARALARRAYSLSRANDNAAGLMHAFMLAGDVALGQGRLDDARANFKQALRQEELVRDPAQRASALVKLGAAAFAGGDFADAAASTREADDLARRLGEARIGATARIERARALRALGRTAEARSALASAFRSALSLSAAPLVARALGELAALERQAGNDEYARRLEQAIGGAPDLNQRADEARQRALERLAHEAEYVAERL